MHCSAGISSRTDAGLCVSYVWYSRHVNGTLPNGLVPRLSIFRPPVTKTSLRRQQLPTLDVKSRNHSRMTATAQAHDSRGSSRGCFFCQHSSHSRRKVAGSCSITPCRSTRDHHHRLSDSVRCRTPSTARGSGRSLRPAPEGCAPQKAVTGLHPELLRRMCGHDFRREEHSPVSS